MVGQVDLKNAGGEGALSKLKNASFKSKAGTNKEAQGKKKVSERLEEIKTHTQKAKDNKSRDITRKGLNSATLAIQNTASETGKGGKLKILA